MPPPKVVHTISELQLHVNKAQLAGLSVGFVPTMGALHDGHLSLVENCHEACEFCVVSIFVNPSQFGEGEDFDQYPRTLDDDVAKLGSVAVDVVFAPSESEVYPRGCSTEVRPPNVAGLWEGERRPHHFQGVATVVLKLLNMVQPDIAFFGQKDFQQLRVIQKMVRDLNVPVHIAMCPIIRETDGLAMSSRNAYLNPTHRARAPAIYQSLQHATELIAQGETNPGRVRDAMTSLLNEAGIDDIDYIAIVHPQNLEPVDEVAKPLLLAIAAKLGETRLIDNHLIQ